MLKEHFWRMSAKLLTQGFSKQRVVEELKADCLYQLKKCQAEGKSTFFPGMELH
jgi:hypothetical protein